MPPDAADTASDPAAPAQPVPPVPGAGPAAESAAGPTGEGAPAPDICPYCGDPDTGPTACNACGARTDPLSRQATQNEMGPWFVRDERQPFRPGCRLETLERWARVGRITPETVVRGPSTRQNWMPASRVPGVARLFGVCHACDGSVTPDEVICRACGAGLDAVRDRQHLGLAPERPLPGRMPPAALADRLVEPSRPAARPHATPSVPAPMPPAAALPSPGQPHQPNQPPAQVSDRASARVARLERRVRARTAQLRLAIIAAAALALLFVAQTLLLRGGSTPATTADAAASSPAAGSQPGTQQDGSPAAAASPPGDANDVDAPDASTDAP